jgi:quercetin dioxygenase-like cupin family protein
MNNLETCEQIIEQVQGNIFLRPVHGNKGYVIEGHEHNFDHVSFCISGSIRVKFGKPEDPEYHEETYHAGEHFLVKATIRHQITFLEDGTRFFCIYSHRGPNGEVVQEFPGKGIPHREASPGSESAYQ